MNKRIFSQSMLRLVALLTLAASSSLFAAYNIVTVAGVAPGAIDGTGTAARFNHPFSVAIDSNGNAFVADTYSHTIRKVTPGGVVTTFAGVAGQMGPADGTGSAARFSSPSSIVIDGADNLYVADTGNHAIRKITPGGVVSTLADSDQGYDSPSALAIGTISTSTYLFVADLNILTPITKIDLSDTTIANVPIVTGTMMSVQSMAMVGSNTLYLADSENQTISKLVISSGNVTTLAGVDGIPGSDDGVPGVAHFRTPTGIAADGLGNLYVADGGNHLIRRVTASTGEVLTVAGSTTPGNLDGIGSSARFFGPTGVAIAASGNLYVTDGTNCTIRVMTVSDSGVTTLAGKATAGSDDGSGAAARFRAPIGVVVDAAGNTYVADTDNNTIRKIASNGSVSTFAGTAGQTGTTNAIGTAARFSAPQGLAVDSAGNLFVADTNNHTIRKIVIATGEVTTFAGIAGSTGHADNTGTAASFAFPVGLAIDDLDNIYVADSGNHIVRKITPVGLVSTLAGDADSPGNLDGTGAAAQFLTPTGIAVDAAREVYVADTDNHTIRKINPAGDVLTIAGTGAFGYLDATGTTAAFAFPASLAVDRFGNVLVADTNNNVIRKIGAGAVVTTVAGQHGVQGSLDGFDDVAQFNGPKGIAVDSSGQIFVTDWSNNTIRKGTLENAPVVLGGLSATYDGTAKSATATTTPLGLTVNITYNGSATAPTNAGSYAIVATVFDENYSGTASGTLVIAKATASVTLGSLSATYDGSPKSVSATTNPASLTVNFTYDGNSTAPTNAGTYAVVGTVVDTNYAGSDSGTLTISATSQSISFSGPSDQTFGVAPLTLSATASSGLPVSFSVVSGPASVSGTTLTITGAGDVTVRASQAGNSNYNAATNIDRTFNVAKANQTITFAGPGNQTFGVSPITLTGSSDSSLAVTFSVVSGPASITGGTLTITGAGTVVLRASQGGNTNYNAAPDVDRTITVAKANQTISFTGPSAQTFGVAPLTLSASTTSSLAISFSVVSGPATVSGNQLTITGAGSVTVRASQSGNTNYNAASDVDQTFTVAKANQTITFAGPGDQTFGVAPITLSGSSDSSLAVTFSVVSGPASITGGTLTITGAGSVVVRASQVGNTNYNAATDVDRTITVAKATVDVTLGNLSATWDGTMKSATATTTPASLTVTFTYNGSATAPTNPGSYAVVATVNETNYQGTASGTLTISDPGPSITAHSAARNVIIPGQGATLSVTALGYGTVTYQWSHNGHLIQGATNNSLPLTNASIQDNGYYLVTVTNGAGSVRAAPFFVTVAPAQTQIVAWGTDQEGQVSVPVGLTDAVAILAGGSHSLAIRQNGTVAAWGRNLEGQTTVPSGLSDVVAVAAGGDHSVALKSDGTVVAWGTPDQSLVPTGLSDVVAIAAREGYTLALKADGTVVGWPAANPVTNIPAGLTHVTAIAAGGYCAVAIKDDSTLVGWGANYYDQLTIPNGLAGPTSVALATYYSAVALNADGTIAEWGSGGGGTRAPSNLSNVVQISAGYVQLLALKGDGTIATWGAEYFGELSAPSFTGAFAVSGGGGFSLALRDSSSGTTPAVTTQPQGLTKVVGNSATFTATASGTPAPTYQWKRNGADITGATSASYTISSVVSSDAGTYTVVASNSAGSTTSQAATLTVNKAGATVTLGNLTATYDGSPKAATATTNPSGKTVTFTYNGSATAPTNAGSYTVVGTMADADYYGSATGTLVIAKATPTVNWPTPAPILSGTALSSTQLNATASVPGSFVYSPALGAVLGVGNQTLNLTFTPTSTTNYNTVTVQRTLLVSSSSLPPTITQHPVNQTVNAGGTTTFTVTATGTPAPGYQWQRNGINIPGATGATLTIDSTSAINAGSYTLIATNPAGTVTSNAATLTVQTESSIWLMNGTAFKFGVSLGYRDSNWQLVTAADFNGDNKPDILLQNTVTGERQIQLLDGANQTSTVSLGILDPSWQMVAATDFNGDNKPDIVLQNTVTGQRALWLMNGTTFVSSTDLGTYDLSWRIATAADFDGDGKADLLWQNTVTGQCTIWLMNGTSFVWSVDLGTYDLKWRMAAVADFDGDGKVDIVWQDAITGQRNLWLMNGTQFIYGVDLGTYDLSWRIVAVADFDRDGKKDILWQRMSFGQTGTADLGIIDPNWKMAGTADFNADGNADIVWQNLATGQRAIWLMNGTTFSYGVDLGTVDVNWQIAAIADFNHDGKPDLVWQNLSTGQRAVWLMNGTAYGSAVDLGVVDANWRIATAADFNADGSADIVWQNVVTGQRSIWLMNGTAYSSGIDLGTADTSWRIAAAADFTGDGKPDVLWQNASTGQVVVWRMNGVTGVEALNFGTYDTNLQCVGAANFDHRGGPDLLWQNVVTGQRSIFLISGSGY